MQGVGEGTKSLDKRIFYFWESRRENSKGKVTVQLKKDLYMSLIIELMNKSAI